MAKKYYNFNFELDVDGKSYSPAKVLPLFQHDPFPGGHKYSCVISGNELIKYFYDLPLGKSKGVSKDVARRFFSSLGLSWDQNTKDEEVAIEYFLNNVEDIDFDGEYIKFSGVCSLIVRV